MKVSIAVQNQEISPVLKKNKKENTKQFFFFGRFYLIRTPGMFFFFLKLKNVSCEYDRVNG